MDIETEYENMVEERIQDRINSEVTKELESLLQKFAQRRALNVLTFGPSHPVPDAWDDAMFLVNRAIELRGPNS